MFHLHRNVFSQMLSGKVREINHRLRVSHRRESPGADKEKVDTAIAEPQRQRLTRAASHVMESFGKTLSYFAFPDGDYCSFNNPLERIMVSLYAEKQNGQSGRNMKCAKVYGHR